MKKFGWLGVLIFLLLHTLLYAAPDRFFPYPYEELALDNGFKAILIPMKGSGLVAYYTIVRTGSRDEWEPGKSGFAHFFEHMMFRGTEKYSADQYNQLVSEVGADANAYTTDDYTCYHLAMPGRSLETVMDLESDRFQNLSYKEGVFRTEAGAVYGEYRKSITNPWDVAEEAIYNKAFDKHTYKHTTIGFEADIKRMPTMYRYSKRFFKRYYRPENCVLLLVGEIDTEKTRALIQKYYGKWKSGYVNPRITPEPPQKKERSVSVQYKGKTLPIVWVGYKGDQFDTNNIMSAAAYLLGELAFGENSEIYKKLVIREQKLRTIDSKFRFNRDPNLYSIYAQVKEAKDIDYVKAVIDSTIKTFRETLVDRKQLENLQKRTRYSYLMSLDTPGNVADALSRYIALTGGIKVVDQLNAIFSSLKPDDIRKAAQKYLRKERRTVLTLKGDQS